MSGGHFDYKQYDLKYMIDDIEQLIIDNHRKNEFGYSRNYPDDIIEEFRKAVEILKLAEVYVQRIDYLVCGDDGEENFRKRLKKDLEEL